MKQFFYLLSVMLLLICPSLSMAQDTSTVIWEEDFTGCTELPSKGKNATYKYSGAQGTPVIHFANLADGISPELNLIKYSILTVTVQLDGAYENLRLSFKKSDNNNKIIVYISKPEKKISVNSDGSYSIPASKGDQSVHFSIKYNNSSGNAYIDNLKLTGIRPSKTSSDISYNVDEVSTYADEFMQPVLQNPNNLQSFTYWSSDQSVATVDSNGEVKINGIGKTTISAIFHGSETYGYQEASYVLNVKHKSPAGEVFYESFDDNLSSGGNVGYTYGESSGEAVFDNANMTDRNKRIIPAYKCINFEVQSKEKGVYTIKSIQGLCGDATLTFRVKGYSSEPTLTLSATNASLSESELVVKADEWQDVSIQLSNIKSGCSITFTGGYLFLDDVSIVTYAPVPIGKYGYATLYYGDKTLTVPDGMTAFTMKVEDEQVVESKRYEAGTTIPQATAVVLKADAGEYKLYPSQEEGVTDSSNELKGSDESATTTGGDIYYRLSAHEGNVGFYWGANGGGAFTNGAHKAYLVMSKSSGAKKIRSGYPFHSNTTTWIEEISDNANDDKAPCFNLSGQRVGSNYHGIMIRNGKKIFVK